MRHSLNKDYQKVTVYSKASNKIFFLHSQADTYTLVFVLHPWILITGCRLAPLSPLENSCSQNDFLKERATDNLQVRNMKAFRALLKQGVKAL